MLEHKKIHPLWISFYNECLVVKELGQIEYYIFLLEKEK